MTPSRETVTLRALSVVVPWGAHIAEGVKRVEVRRWQPDRLPIDDLLIVENKRRLLEPGETDAEGRAVAVVTIAEVVPWTRELAGAACSEWEAGWLAWTITNVRPILRPFRVLAARKLYDVAVAGDLLPSSFRVT